MGLLGNLMLGTSRHLSKEQFHDLVDKVYAIDNGQIAYEIDSLFYGFWKNDDKRLLFDYVIHYLSPNEYRSLMGQHLLPWRNN